jgi:predicted nuclease of predicted toxin-antitoxin system
MKLLIDMNLSPLWTPFLAGEGVETIHWSTVGQPGATDSEILDFAAANGWIVFTHDLDFGTLLATLRTNKPTVIQVRSQDVLPAAIGSIVWSAPFGPPNHTSKRAPSSLWTPSAIAFGCCRSDNRKHQQIRTKTPKSACGWIAATALR